LHEKYIENAEEKLEAAEYLLKGGFYNDAVSRAYYSMFYSAKALLSLKEIYPKAHKGVITKFGLEFVKKGFVDRTYKTFCETAVDTLKSPLKRLKSFSRQEETFWAR